ncbi:MAG: hypothetical protein LBK03_00275 [Bacteroidales bacterium]|jgi:hypothetical protein|nr:hypothetical protein [Bacteroidales bacterium]
MRKKTAVILIAFFIFTGLNNSLTAQTDDVPLPKSLQPYKPRNDNERGERKVAFFAGGGFGLQLGSYIAVDVSPQIAIYPVVKWLALGISGTYMFAHDSYFKYNQHIFGGGLFIEGYPIKWLILHAGYEYLNYPKLALTNGKVEVLGRIGTHAVMAGPGYRQHFNDKVNGYLLVLFNLYQTETSIYTGYFPTFRIGITVDF